MQRHDRLLAKVHPGHLQQLRLGGQPGRVLPVAGDDDLGLTKGNVFHGLRLPGLVGVDVSSLDYRLLPLVRRRLEVAGVPRVAVDVDLPTGLENLFCRVQWFLINDLDKIIKKKILNSILYL